MKWQTPYLFLVVLAVPSVARTQELDTRTDEPWESAWDDSWSTQWDSGLWANEGHLSLDLMAGRRSMPLEQIQLAATGRTTVEHYFLAQLRLPLDFLFGLSGATRMPVDSMVPWSRLPDPPQVDEAEEDAGRGDETRREFATGGPGSMAAPTPEGVRGFGVPSAPREQAVRLSTSSPSAAGARDRASDFPLGEGAAPAEGDADEAAPANSRALGSAPAEEVSQIGPGPLPHAFVEEVLSRAVTAQGAQASFARLRSLARRSRASGLLPEVRVRGVGGFDRTQSLDSDGLLPGDTSQRSGSDSLLELRLTFHLERLLVGDEEAGVERLRGQLAKNVQDLEEDVLTTLLDWDEARRQCSRSDLPREELADALLRHRRLSVILDVRTGGWFRGGAALADFPAQGPRPGASAPLGSDFGGR